MSEPLEVLMERAGFAGRDPEDAFHELVAMRNRNPNCFTGADYELFSVLSEQYCESKTLDELMAIAGYAERNPKEAFRELDKNVRNLTWQELDLWGYLAAINEYRS